MYIIYSKDTYAGAKNNMLVLNQKQLTLKLTQLTQNYCANLKLTWYVDANCSQR